MVRISIGVALLAYAGVSLSGIAVGAEASKPNIVLILADDLGYGSLGCYGNKEVRTPNIDQLATSGIRLTDFHSNGAMCTPTRAALMTGRYQQRCAWVPDEELSPVFRKQRKQNPVQRWAWGISSKEVVLPKLLQQAAYRTGLIGKWHLGYDAKFHPMNYGFDEFRGFVGGNVDYHTHIAGYGLKEVDWWMDRNIQNEPGYTTDLLTCYATDFIQRNKDRPFFLYLAQGAPHEPWQGRESNKNQSQVEVYKEMIQVLDESVGKVIAALRENHLDSKTLVVFCSDNGPAVPQDFVANDLLQGKKGSMLEGGHRVPFIASWPGVIPAGITSHRTMMTMDFLPTFAKLSSARLPDGHTVDGADMMPHLLSVANQSDRVLHWTHADAWAVRKGAWKLVGQGENAQKLFNLDNDLSEKNNLMQQNPEVADELIKLHRSWTADVDIP